MNTTRNKRWNGNLDSLSVDYLKDVAEKMIAYGDRVQFDFPGKGQRPNYQVINKTEKKMAFDGKNLLLRPNSDGNVSNTLSAIFTLEQVNMAITGSGIRRSVRTPVSRAAGISRSSAHAIKAKDPVDSEKYEYFKANRETLPSGIEKYSAQITDLMQNGLSAENAFGEIIKKHF